MRFNVSGSLGVFGLVLLGCFGGCGDDDDGGNPTDGARRADSSLPGTNLCTSVNDLVVFTSMSLGPQMNQDIQAVLRGCSLQCFTQPAAEQDTCLRNCITT